MSNCNPGGSELVIRVPKVITSDNRKLSVLKFGACSDIDLNDWSTENLELQRENNESIFVPDDDQPKSGVGSEFGKQAREEARRKKMGYSKTKYCKDNQPWLLSVNSGSSKQCKKYRGIKEGTVSQNVDYWVFVRQNDNTLEAYPVDDWYAFMPIGRYKTLDADEAEEKFSQRNRILNQFALKIKEQLQGLENNDETDGKAKSSKDREVDDEKAKVKKKRKPKKSKKADEEGENFIASADSDDGDDEGREVDYMSDTDLSVSSEEEPEVKIRQALIGVDEEEGIKKLIESDDEENEQDQQEDDENGDVNVDKVKKFDAKLSTLRTVGADEEDKGSESSSDSEDPDEENVKSPFFMKEVKKPESGPSSSTEAGDEPSAKRKIKEEPASGTPAKKPKVDKEKIETTGITEDEVRRYLQRKPQSSKELVAKFKPRCQGMSKAEVVKLLADILKRLGPEQVERNGTMYFSLKK
uniref:Transcription initiation factor IIF subunit alpha n=1 Tax=Romanomermis culicivorax TaxID=13658 RepID=A0A915L0V7_ROMCU